MTALFHITSERARSYIVNLVMTAPIDHTVRIRPPTRSESQSRKLHATFGDIAKQETYIGRQLNSVQWKNLFISGHAIATGLGVDMVPGIEGEFVNIRESSADMSIERMSSLLDYTISWQAMNGDTA